MGGGTLQTYLEEFSSVRWGILHLYQGLEFGQGDVSSRPLEPDTRRFNAPDRVSPRGLRDMTQG